MNIDEKLKSPKRGSYTDHIVQSQCSKSLVVEETYNWSQDNNKPYKNKIH